VGASIQIIAKGAIVMKWSEIKTYKLERINETVNEFHTRILNEVQAFSSGIKIVDATIGNHRATIKYRKKISQGNVVIHGDAKNNTVIVGNNNVVSG